MTALASYAEPPTVNTHVSKGPIFLDQHKPNTRRYSATTNFIITTVLKPITPCSLQKKSLSMD